MTRVHAVLVAVVLAAGFLVVDSVVAQSKYSTDPTPGWQVPRTPDGKPDLQGVWGNNSVTPMTRPTQWKDKATLTDAEVEELKQMAARSVDESGDAIFGNFVQQLLNARDKGEYKQCRTTRPPATTTSSGWPNANGTTAPRSSPIRPMGSSRR